MQDCIGALFSSDSIRIVVLYIDRARTGHQTQRNAELRLQLAARLRLVGGASIRCLYLAGETSERLRARVAPSPFALRA